jgi:hypothetical protein
MLSGAEALHDQSVHTHRSLVWFSDDGFYWSEKTEIGDPDFWLWRTTWKNGSALNFGYACGQEKSLRLYKSNNGMDFKTLVENLKIEGYPNETAVVYKGDSAFCLLRRDAENNTAFIGTSTPPYTNWQWKDLGVHIGGPQMLLLPNGKFFATVRLYDGDGWLPAHTSLCRVNPYSGNLTEALKLPSGGDTSYAGMVFWEDIVWVSYYSSHEGKTAIYLAKVTLNDRQK